jgi:membrane fusion protein (multidrug efflux system)
LRRSWLWSRGYGSRPKIRSISRSTGSQCRLEECGGKCVEYEAQIKEQQAIVSEGQSAVDGDQAVLDFAQQQLDRYKSLATSGSGTVERLKQAESDVGQRRAAWQHDLAALDAARAHQAVLQTQLVQAKATFERQQAHWRRHSSTSPTPKSGQRTLAVSRTRL